MIHAGFSGVAKMGFFGVLSGWRYGQKKTRLYGMVREGDSARFGGLPGEGRASTIAGVPHQSLLCGHMKNRTIGVHLSYRKFAQTTSVLAR